MSTENQNEIAEIKETFWQIHKEIKRKTTKKEIVKAQIKMLDFAKDVLAELNDEQLAEAFGDYANYAKRWINGELVTNKFGAYLYVKLGE